LARKYLIETFGCQMNVHDSERMAGLLEQAGYEATDEAADADVVVINTCSVRERAEEKLYTRLGELRQMGTELGHDPIVAIAGCVAQQEGEALLKRSPGVADVIVGTQAIRKLPMLIEQAAQVPGPGAGRKPASVIDLSAQDDVSWPLGVTRRGDPVKAYITIIEGCNEFCSFCVVPYTRGIERMRPKADILAEVRDAAASGRREVQLLGQIVNH
jgi:tRNA-2-methylthio-N6-dimethylallyladenosine synthase